MGALNYRSTLALLVMAGAVALVFAGCTNGKDGPGSPTPKVTVTFRDVAAGLAASIPPGWHHVETEDLPGATIPLHFASFRTGASISSLCQPGRVLEAIPRGGALLQILDNSKVEKPAGLVPGAHSTSAGSKRAVRAAYPALEHPHKVGAPRRSHECGEVYSLSFRLEDRPYQMRVWSSPNGPSENVKADIESMMNSLRLSRKKSEKIFRSNRLPISGRKAPFGREVPWIALDCPTPNSFKCDRVFFSVKLERPATRLEAWVAGRRVEDLHSGTKPPGSLNAGRRGYGWAGTLHPAGMSTPGSSLEIKTSKRSHANGSKQSFYYAGDPPVRVDIKVKASFPGDREVTRVFRDQLLGAGHG